MIARYLRSLASLFAITVALSPALLAQTFVGSDNFDSGATSKWDYVYRLNSATDGSLAFSNSRLDYTTSVTGTANQYRLWDSDGTANAYVTATSFTTSWVMQFTATNMLANPGGSNYANIGLQVYDDGNEYFALMLGSTSSGFNIRSEGTGTTATVLSTADSSDVTLRLAWNAGTQVLSASYSLDGSSFNSVSTFNPITGWTSATKDDGFNFGVFGTSVLSSGTIASGIVYADNFSVSAVPEPSTYAAIAGVMALGVAAWHRRRAAKS